MSWVEKIQKINNRGWGEGKGGGGVGDDYSGLESTYWYSNFYCICYSYNLCCIGCSYIYNVINDFEE